MERVLARRRELFWSLLDDVVGLLDATASEAVAECVKRVTDADRTSDAALAAVCDALDRPLKKGSARYAKAIQSITGGPACVHHAMHYCDTTAICSTLEEEDAVVARALRDIEGHERFRDVWSLSCEAHEAACKVLNRTIEPAAPSADAIAADIARRKDERQKGGDSAADMDGSLREAVSRVVKLRGLDESAVGAIVAECQSLTQDDASALQPLDAASFEILKRKVPSLGDAPFDEADENKALRALVGLLSMKTAIPATMMRCIESTATSLMHDIQQGTTDLSQLDLNEIGTRVLHGVSSEDIAAFTQNIDKILPALSGDLAKFPNGNA